MNDNAKSGAQHDLHLHFIIPGLYKHYHGGLYYVFANSVDESTGTLLVHYYSLERRTRWTRTITNFTQHLPADGVVDGIPRFQWLRRATADELYFAMTDTRYSEIPVPGPNGRRF